MARYGIWSPIPQRVNGVNKWVYGRYGRRLTAVVIHRMDGSLESSEQWLKSSASGTASTHFGVGSWNGVPQIRQWVDTANSAWGWGARPNDVPTSLAYKVLAPDIFNPSADLNWQVISVEVEGWSTEYWPSTTTAKVKELLNWIYRTHGNLYIMAHTDCSWKPCPGMFTFKTALPNHYGNLLGNIYGTKTVSAPATKSPTEAWPVKFKEKREYGYIDKGVGLFYGPSNQSKLHWIADERIKRYMIGATLGQDVAGTNQWYFFWSQDGATESTYDGDLIYVHASQVEF
jgi:hypothetical protein